jgi:hypothetical protein
VIAALEVEVVYYFVAVASLEVEVVYYFVAVASLEVEVVYYFVAVASLEVEVAHFFAPVVQPVEPYYKHHVFDKNAVEFVHELEEHGHAVAMADLQM